ncbi:MAG: redoxin family protein [Xanthomonadaceae bacterium]|nr:redoxin family protein [Xanthomonadaceae bacterium]MBU6477402.1 redoxin family protein [Xanthomonadaceae bacterium]MDE2223820.1 redoxin family protein [Xanthomonadaceae bacterium]MDE2497848.1 redoxin family protein [Xanthomonadaceae bacterium]TAN03276.1 MAG: redoxin domain-containing protein [Rhodanobacteraceae bacterium]
MRLRAGDLAPQLRLVDVEGNPVMLGRRTHRTLLCFFGDAACAFCNVYIYDLIERYQRLASLGLDVIVLYNARQESVWRFVSSHPRSFPVIADHSAIAYRAYGVEHSLWGKLKGVVTRAPTFVKGLRMVGVAGLNANTTMPANFLIDTNSRIAEAHYGVDPGDHIPFQRVEAFASHGSAGVECIDNARSVAGATTLLRNGVRGQ